MSSFMQQIAGLDAVVLARRLIGARLTVRGAGVLIRALDPDTGLDLMRARRPAPPLCSGPGRLTQALDIRPDDDGAAFDGPDFGIVLAAAVPDLLVGPRIGISRAQDLPWRFGLAGAAGLSRPFPRARPDR